MGDPKPAEPTAGQYATVTLDPVGPDGAGPTVTIFRPDLPPALPTKPAETRPLAPHEVAKWPQCPRCGGELVYEIGNPYTGDGTIECTACDWWEGDDA